MHQQRVETATAPEAPFRVQWRISATSEWKTMPHYFLREAQKQQRMLRAAQYQAEAQKWNGERWVVA